LVDPYPNLAYVINEVEELGDMLMYPHVTHWFDDKLPTPMESHTVPTRHHPPSRSLKKLYDKFSIEWFGGPDVEPITHSERFERYVVTAIESLLAKLPGYAQFVREEARSGTLVSVEITPQGEPLLIFDFWYDNIVNAFGLWIRLWPEGDIGRVEFPKEIWL